MCGVSAWRHVWRVRGCVDIWKVGFLKGFGCGGVLGWMDAGGVNVRDARIAVLCGGVVGGVAAVGLGGVMCGLYGFWANDVVRREMGCIVYTAHAGCILCVCRWSVRDHMVMLYDAICT